MTDNGITQIHKPLNYEYNIIILTHFIFIAKIYIFVCVISQNICYVHKYEYENYNRTAYIFIHVTYKNMYITSINIDVTYITFGCHIHICGSVH